MPRNLQAEGPSLLIAAISARALAQSARRAGFTPLAVDFFADTDTRQAAHACRKLAGGMDKGLRGQPLLRALDALAELAPSPILGVVYGAGFEDRPELLTLIAKRWKLLGNDADTVRRIKAPKNFFAELDRLGIPHPLTTNQRPAKGAGWLAKKTGGAGGSHIVPSRLARGAPEVYYQQRVEGRAVSALFVGNGNGARVLGFSEQWTAPKPRSPWRYGGAVRPAFLPEAAARRMTAAVMDTARAFEIKGLASADFMVNGDEALLLEINPRPGATLDIFDRGATPLLRLHIEAVSAGTLPRQALKFGDAMASAIVYADAGGGATPAGFVWPEWAADRPKSSERIDKNRPICTVVARGSTRSRAKRRVEERICTILAIFQSVSRGEDGEPKRKNRRAPNGATQRQRQGGAARQSSHR